MIHGFREQKTNTSLTNVLTDTLSGTASRPLHAIYKQRKLKIKHSATAVTEGMGIDSKYSVYLNVLNAFFL